MSRIRVLLVDDVELARRTIRYELRKEEGIEIVGEAGDGDTAIEMARRLRPDVLVTDIVHPGLDGYELTRAVSEQLDEVKVVVYSAYISCIHIEQSLQAGAKGVLLKPEPTSVLKTAIETVASGREFLSPGASPLPSRPRPTTRAARRQPKPDW